MRLFSFVFLAGCIFGGIAAAEAAPEFVRLSIVGDPATSMGIAWNTLSGQPTATVQYGTTSGVYQSKITGKVQPKISNTLGTVTEATLSGLTPDTKYYYRVGGSGAFSSEYSFRTAPPTNPTCGVYKFTYAGDSRAEVWETDKGASVKWPLISLKALSFKPRFMLHGGDIVYDGKNEKQWAHMFKLTTPVSSVLPIMPGLGNHDDGPTDGEGANYNKLYFLPRAQKALGGHGVEDYYHFRFGNGIFISLSTESFSEGTTKFKKQADWMDQVLSKYPARWKVVFLHKPIYTENLILNHPADEEGQNQAFVPVINKHHVDIVVGSHNHYYERFAPSNCKNGASKVPCKVAGYEQGTVFMTSGGGGAFPLFISGGTNAVRLATSGKHHFLLFAVEHHKLTMQALDENGLQIDSFTIKKTPPSPDPCPTGANLDAGSVLPDAGVPDATALDGTVADSVAGKDVSDPAKDGPATTVDQGSAAKVDSQAPLVDSGGATDPPASSGGCDCNVAFGQGSLASLALLLFAGVLLLRRHRRKQNR